MPDSKSTAPVPWHPSYPAPETSDALTLSLGGTSVVILLDRQDSPSGPRVVVAVECGDRATFRIDRAPAVKGRPAPVIWMNPGHQARARRWTPSDRRREERRREELRRASSGLAPAAGASAPLGPPIRRRADPKGGER